MSGARRHPNHGAGAPVPAAVAEDRARVEWWRRSSFMLLGVVFALLGGWLMMLSDGVQENAADVDELRMSLVGISADLRVLTSQLGNLATAQRETTRELATIAGILDHLKTQAPIQIPGPRN